jgi:hypothetical protein
MENQEAYQRAKQRVEAKFGFYIHLAVYLVVNGLLLTINLLTAPGEYWFLWPLLGWGIGLLFHGLGVFVFVDGIGIKVHMIEKEMRKQDLKK